MAASELVLTHHIVVESEKAELAINAYTKRVLADVGDAEAQHDTVLQGLYIVRSQKLPKHYSPGSFAHEKAVIRNEIKNATQEKRAVFVRLVYSIRHSNGVVEFIRCQRNFVLSMAATRVIAGAGLRTARDASILSSPERIEAARRETVGRQQRWEDKRAEASLTGE